MLTAPAWPEPRPTTVTPAQPPHPNTPVIASARWLDFDPWNASLQRMQGNTIDLDFIPPSMRRVVYERIVGGELEVFYRRDVDEGRFVDNVNVLKQDAALPKTPRVAFVAR